MSTANKVKSPFLKLTWTQRTCALLLTKQKEAWLANGIPDYATRINRMDRLIALLVDNKDEIAATLSGDYGRRSLEGSLFLEVLYVVNVLKYNKVHLREWMKPELHEAPFPDAVARVEFQPKGVVGVVSPWNFPWTLAFGPIADIFAAGNVCMLKPSELAPRTSALIARLVAQFFHETEFTVLQGGRETGAAFAALPFDHLIYTGGTKIGRSSNGSCRDGITSGGVTINDCMAHISVTSLPHGGIGPSGMGAYRGKTGFLTFSHARSIYRQSRSPQAEHLLRPPFGSQTRAFLSAAITRA